MLKFLTQMGKLSTEWTIVLGESRQIEHRKEAIRQRSQSNSEKKTCHHKRQNDDSQW